MPDEFFTVMGIVIFSPTGYARAEELKWEIIRNVSSLWANRFTAYYLSAQVGYNVTQFSIICWKGVSVLVVVLVRGVNEPCCFVIALIGISIHEFQSTILNLPVLY